MKFEKEIYIKNTKISIDSPTYFIADIAANHDGDIERAKDLIWLAKESGADAVKFQHFTAEKIVSDFGFRKLGGQLAHQANWNKSVFDTYKEYECSLNWTNVLLKTSSDAGIDFLTTPYDLDAVKILDKHLPAYKIGSGDITWIDFIKQIADRNKPILIATGASNIDDVRRVVNSIAKINNKLILMQCNTNYTGSIANFKFINIRVLNTYAKEFPGIVLGLSDHTPGHTTVLGAITLGARVIEKHFTDNTDRAGPDHLFSMSPISWLEMINRSRELEMALGDSIKKIEANEIDSSIVQRRSIRLKRDMKIGEIVENDDIEMLRPAPIDSCPPYMSSMIIGRSLNKSISAGDVISLNDLE
jgi:N-acetylneuraminate synthase